jgi:hypothetical protein
MPTISNNYQACELLNLASNAGGRGPFVVRQVGSPPGSVTFEQDRYLLRKDGTWVINLAVFALSEKEKGEFLFPTSAEALSVLNGLSGEPVVQTRLPEGKSREELKAAAQNTLTGIWGQMHSAKSSA